MIKLFGEQISIKLELSARRALNIKEKNGMGGIFSANYIEKHRGAFTVLCAALAPYYLNSTEEQRKTLDEMINRYQILEEDCSSEEYFKTTNRAAEELKSLLNDLGVQDAE
ncbi:hypothetical protein [Aquibacillus salsiterrae]|uniref:Uncharacterized protein n=1 Tax=Aquibacillus salsiterrae TaxID=2950439 RepID=A0A9X3WE10_9BACI|nr:hypothetical protein [Aquibacillus salsiterrae]MDC3417972.1 hypothetical protein [Aquibacillus salsiterrae]